jgi:hypothetical protein
MLLKEKVIHIVMKNNLNDNNPTVASAAYGLLRNLVIEQGYEVAVFMFRQDIFASIAADLNKLESVTAGSETLKGEELNQAMEFIENVFGLVGALVNSADVIYDSVDSKTPTLGTMCVAALKYLQPQLKRPEALFGFNAILELCYSLTDKNTQFATQVNGYDWDSIDKTISPATMAYVNGVKLNLYVLGKGQTPTVLEQIMKDVVEMVQGSDLDRAFDQQKPVVDSADAKTVTEANDRAIKARSLIDAVQVSLEILADIAELIGTDDQIAAEPASMEMDEMEDEDMSDEAYFEKSISMDVQQNGDRAEIDGDIEFGNYNQAQLTGPVRYCLHNILPLVVKLLSMDEFKSTAMYALNNVCWTLQATVPLSDGHWKMNAEELWVNLVKVFGDCQDVTVLTPCIGALEAISRLFQGEVPADKEFCEHLTVKCKELQATAPGEDTNLFIIHTLRLMTVLCVKTEEIGRVEAVGAFLLEIIGSSPDVPADILAEALNSLFDIFGDMAYVYDEPIFVQGGMLNALQGFLPKVRQAVKRVDKKKNRKLRNVVDEACLNFARFIDYKRKERK